LRLIFYSTKKSPVWIEEPKKKKPFDVILGLTLVYYSKDNLLFRRILLTLLPREVPFALVN